MVGAFFQCYKSPVATFNSIMNFRKSYPDSTVVLLSDNGYNYEKMANYFNAIYIHSGENFGVAFGENKIIKDISRFSEYLSRLKYALTFIKENFFMWLEDDVYVREAYTEAFLGTINGNCINKIPATILNKIPWNQSNNTNLYFSGHGGSIYNTKEFLNILGRNEISWLISNWTNLLEPSWGQTLDNELFFSIAVLTLGGSIYSLNGHKDGIEYSSSANVIHQYKKYYNIKPNELIQGLFDESIPIIINAIDFSKLHDVCNEPVPRQCGYHLLDFKYEIDNSLSLNSNNIEKNIHLIWIGSIIKDSYYKTVIKCKEINELFSVYLWIDKNTLNKEQLIELESKNIICKNIYTELNTSNSIYSSYISNLLTKLDNYGYKADIIRLYVVHEYGGIYSDIDSVWLKPLDNNFLKEFVCYRIDEECKDIGNSFFGFCKYSYILKNFINNLNASISCILEIKNISIIKSHIPVMTGGPYIVRILRETKPFGLNYMYQPYCMIGGPHEKLHSSYSKDGKSYCYQTFDGNWCK